VSAQVVFWASGPVFSYCESVCGLQDSLNLLLDILNDGKDMVDKNMVEFLKIFITFFLVEF
jgi:hypothetical protein